MLGTDELVLLGGRKSSSFFIAGVSWTLGSASAMPSRVGPTLPVQEQGVKPP